MEHNFPNIWYVAKVVLKGSSWQYSPSSSKKKNFK